MWLTKCVCHVHLHTYGWYGHHGSTAASIAVGSHNTDSVYHIVGNSDWNTCSTGGEGTNTWTDSDGVVDRSPTITLWGQPPHREGHTVPTILLHGRGESPGRGDEIYRRRNLAKAKTRNVICLTTSTSFIFTILLNTFMVHSPLTNLMANVTTVHNILLHLHTNLGSSSL